MKTLLVIIAILLGILTIEFSIMLFIAIKDNNNIDY